MHMASSSFPAKSSSSSLSSLRPTIDAQDDQARSHPTPHLSSNFNPPPGPGRKRSYGGAPSDPGPGDEPDLRQSESDAQLKAEDGASLHSVDTADSGDAAASAKKRKTSRGSRGVANLTPEQLERKRANGKWTPSPDSAPRSGTPVPGANTIQTVRLSVPSVSASVSGQNSMSARSPSSSPPSPTRSCRTPCAKRRLSRPSSPN
jgi:hypothetical protein